MTARRISGRFRFKPGKLAGHISEDVRQAEECKFVVEITPARTIADQAKWGLFKWGYADRDGMEKTFDEFQKVIGAKPAK